MYIVLMDVFLDVNIFLAVLLDEPERWDIVRLTTGKNILSSSMAPFEIGNALVSMHRTNRITGKEVLAVLANFQKIPVRLVEPNIKESLRLACRYHHYAYDAYYLEAAQRLNKPLMTLDSKMLKSAGDLKITVIEVG